MNNDKRIQDYINKKLRGDERKAFEQSLNTDKELQTSFKEHKAIHNALKLNEAERLKTKLKSYENVNKNHSSKGKLSFFYAIAASFLVLIGVGIYSQYFQQDIYNQYFEVYPNVYKPIVRGNSEKSTLAFMYYENGKFENSQDAFKDLLEDEENPSIKFYYALSLLNSDQTELAIKQFEELGKIDFEFSAEAHWYYALAQIKSKNSEKANSTLELLRSKYPNYQTKKVMDLINDLK